MNYLLEGCESERLFYRQIKREDYNDWLLFFQTPVTSQYWIGDAQLPEEACTQWYEKQAWRYENNKGGMNAIIEKKSGSLVGHCGLLIQVVDNREELEIAYSLLPKFWNNGYATEAAGACKTFAFANHLSHSLISIISISNISSQKVAVKNGMQVEKTTFYKGNEVFIFRIAAFHYFAR